MTRGGSSHRAELLDELDAVHARHLEIGHDDVRRERLVLAERLERVGRRLDLEALIAQQLGERRARVDLVIDDQNST